MASKEDVSILKLRNEIDNLKERMSKLENKQTSNVTGDYKDILKNISDYVNMKPLDKMNFIACNNEDVMYMLDYFVNITKDII